MRLPRARRRRCRCRWGPLLASLLLVVPGGLTAQGRPFPYSLGTGDWIAAPAALASAGLGLNMVDGVDPLSVHDVTALHRSSVNAFDRGATHHWSTEWQDVSDWTRNALVLGAGALTFIPLATDGRWADAVTLGVIFGEAAAITAGVTNITKAQVQRTRPYAYNDDLTPEARAAEADGSGEASLSFFSGHASVAFATATLVSTVYGDMHGSTRGSRLLWATSLSAATLVAYARVEGGMHFPTDVLAGAAVGAAIGHLVPRLHRSGAPPVSVVAAPGYMGLRWRHPR